MNQKRSSWRLPIPSAASTRSVRVGSPVAPEESRLASLAVVLAHRIRGLVTGIEGYTDLLIDSLGSKEQRETALRILESAVRIERVLADLQRYSDPVEPVLRPTQLRSLMGELLVAVEDEDLERIRFDLKPIDQVELEIDPMLMLQALLILVQNALDATRNGGSVLLSATVDPRENQTYFKVHNEGLIDIVDAETTVFSPFYTTKAHNLGVGLAIARRIIVAHGGTLHLTTNSVEDGTCFSIKLPFILQS